MKTLAVVVLLIAGVVAAFAVGRTTAGSSTSIEASAGTKDVTGRIGDVFRVPAVALFCKVDSEVGRPLLSCNHTGETPRHQVRFERSRTVVGRIGYPGNETIFDERP